MLTPYGFGIRRRGGGGGAGSFDPSSYFTGGTVGPTYDFNSSANILNGSATPATNGQTIATVKDTAAGSFDATQATDANRPTLVTSYLNGTSVALSDTTDVFDTISGLNSFTNAANSVCVVAVVRPIDGTTNHTIWKCFDNGFSEQRIYCGFTGLQPTIAYSRDAVNYGNARFGTAITADTWNVLIYQIDAQNGQTGIYMNNGTNLAVAAAGGTTVAGAWAATNGTGSTLMLTSKMRLAKVYIHKNAFPDATQRTALFAAAKSFYNLSTY